MGGRVLNHRRYIVDAIIALIVCITPVPALAFDDNWRFGPKLGFFVFDVDSFDLRSRDRAVGPGLTAGFQAAWIYDTTSKWQAGVEFGFWTKFYFDPEDNYSESALPATVIVTAPFFLRLQYDFGSIAARYQIGVAPSLPATRNDIVELLTGYLGVGVDLEGETHVYSFDLLYQTTFNQLLYNDGSGRYGHGYLLNAGVAW